MATILTEGCRLEPRPTIGPYFVRPADMIQSLEEEKNSFKLLVTKVLFCCHKVLDPSSLSSKGGLCVVIKSVTWWYKFGSSLPSSNIHTRDKPMCKAEINYLKWITKSLMVFHVWKAWKSRRTMVKKNFNVFSCCKNAKLTFIFKWFFCS